MPPKKTFHPLLEEPFAVGESNFADLADCSVHSDNGVIFLCREGAAEGTVGLFRGTIRHNTLIFLLPGMSFRLDDRTPDFRMEYCIFSHDLFLEIAGRFDPAFFRLLEEHPFFYPSDQIAEGAKFWFQIVGYTYRDRENRFRDIIIRNRLQNLFLESYDKMQRFSEQFRERRTSEPSNRQSELFHRFITLVKEHCIREHEVAFYADKLCISTRYLSAIVRNTTQETAKTFIDRAVVLEIKHLLQSTDLSILEIAYRLHFPDQSYLGRYFKKHTGQSPSAFRKSRK